MLSEECTVKNGKYWLFCFALAGLITFLMYDPSNMKLNLYWFGTILALSVLAFELLSMVVAIIMLLMFYLTE